MATNGKFTGFLSQTDILSSKLPEMGLGEQIANWNSPYPDSFSENQRIVYEALKKEGYNDAVIAGIMGNIMQESNFRTSSYNGNEDGGGFCGWLYEYFPEMRGEESAEAQINYLIDTLNNPIHNNQKNTKSALLAIENTPEGARQAAYIFATEYEHCASSSHTSRQDFASNFYESFATGNSGQQINVINNQQVNNTFSSQENQNIENLGENKTESVSSLKDDSDILVNDLPEINLGSQSTDWNSPYPDNFSANQKTVYDALKKEGYNDAVIAGIMGNIMRESGFNTSSYNGNEDGGGFCGWKYEYFPEMRGEESAEAQINYLIDTLNNPIHSNQKNTKSALLAVENTPEGARQAAYIFASEYEHCSDTSDTKRADFASDFYESISN